MTILIKNIQLIDGTGKATRKTDLIIKGKKIAAIGEFGRYKAHQTIDGMGAYLCPGFIDIHTTADRYLNIFSDPSQKDLLLSGVTTIIGGQDGISLAPLLYGSLQFIKEWTDTKKINVNWHTVKEFLKILEKRPIGVNFGTLAGYKTIRRSLIGSDRRELTKNEQKVFKLIIERSLREGAFGISVGAEYFDLYESSHEEIKNILQLISKSKALYATKLHAEGEKQIPFVNKLINLTEESGAKIILSHLEPVKTAPDYEKIVDLISQNSSRADIYFDAYPTDYSVFSVSKLLPDWLKKSGKEKILESIGNEEMKKKILKDLPRLKGSEISIISAPGYDYLEGKTLEEYCANRELAISKGLLNLIETTKGRVIVSRKNINFKKVLKTIINDRAIIASADNHFKESPQTTFIKFLELLAANKILPVEIIVSKMTYLPAQRLGLKNRGVMKVGNFADILIFRDGEIKEVLVNGKRAVKDGQFEDIRGGEVLKHSL
ncbi:hypothetical protein HY227_02630 [Candidatus Wolfebacteria bacterium]|nr:hypothetical protein [Candidatus Wolfebacteria bacterium]